MKSNQKNFRLPKDTPATRKRRLQQRLQEISDKGEQELNMLMQSLEKLKTAFKPTAKNTLADEHGRVTIPKQD